MRMTRVRDQHFYSYDAGFDRLDLLVHHVNRLLNPLVTLSTEEDVVKFLGLDGAEDEKLPFWEGDYNTTFYKQLKSAINIDEHWANLRLQTRAACFLYDKKEYREELQGLRRDAKLLATRDNLRVGLVDNQRLVKKLKAGKYGPRLFPPVSMSSLVLRRYDGVYKVHDITGDDHVTANFWINKNTIKEVEELHGESYRISELIRQPTFLAFVDFEDPRYSKASFQAVEVLREIAPKYSHIVNFFHVNNTLMWHRKRVLGVTWDELPAMAFNIINDASKVMPYPRHREITKEALFDFFDDLFTGRPGSTGQLKPEYKPPSNFSKIRNDTEIEPILLNNTILANRDNFAELVYQEGYDVMVLLYTTEVIHDGQRNVAL